MSNIVFHDHEQQTAPWFALKVLKPFSSSNATAIASAGKGLETLVNKAIEEKYSSYVEENRYTNKDLDRGNELEPQARAIYELENNVTVSEVGFITNDAISSLAGVSPDGLIGDDGMLEIKSPSDKIYTEKLLQVGETGTFKIDSGYQWQMQLQMLVAERKWEDFMFYNPNYETATLMKRVFPDAAKQEKLLIGLKLGEKMYREKDALMKKAMSIRSIYY